jgi:Flavodoxin-like fold
LSSASRCEGFGGYWAEKLRWLTMRRSFRFCQHRIEQKRLLATRVDFGAAARTCSFKWSSSCIGFFGEKGCLSCDPDGDPVCSTTPRGKDSASRTVANTLAARLSALYPSAELVRRDLAADHLPHLDDITLRAISTTDADEAKRLKEAAHRSDQLINELSVQSLSCRHSQIDHRHQDWMTAVERTELSPCKSGAYPIYSFQQRGVLVRVDDAVEQANRLPFGLAACVHSIGEDRDNDLRCY